ncbi:MAG: cytochrome bc complex cytochrome b subunit [Pirellulales bacterium]|nr:cytochrome bc complex cytochrome b subunit [Pirellulales bacterium]
MSVPSQTLGQWFESRTGFRSVLHAALFEPIPGGARWRYVWGSTLVVAFITQVITGVFLWMAYSPSTQTAWESVFYVQHELRGGWLLRGIHHYTAHAMVYLLVIHFLQVVIDGAYRAPRELNFILGLILMLLVMGMAFTGYLLPWDQKGYWATSVGTSLASQAPLVGEDLRKLAVGGTNYGHHTLTRFFALHAGVLPALLVVFLVFHIALFRRHGLHVRHPARGPQQMFWPDQVLKDSLAALAVLAAVLALTIYNHGAELGAPADPANPYDAARPEGYFLFLFQLLKWFPGELELWGAFIMPGIILTYLFLLPWIGLTRAGHAFNVAMICLLMGAAIVLTIQAIHEDNYAAWTDKNEVLAANDPLMTARYEASERFLRAQADAQREAQRIIELAGMPTRIPPTGALALMHEDPYLQGPRLYRQHCGSCHNYENPQERGVAALSNIVNPKPTAPNLYGLGTEAWIAGWLDAHRIVSPDYFGYQGSPFHEGEMASFVQEAAPADADEEQRNGVAEAFASIAAAMAAEAALPTAPKPDAPQTERIGEGRELITGGLSGVVDSGVSCTDCHKFQDVGDVGLAPDLTGYMSRRWLLDFIRNPAGERFYAEKNDRMPAFAPHDDPRLNQLDDHSLELIVDWLRGDWRRAPLPESEPALPPAAVGN